MYVSVRDCMLSATGLSDPFEALESLGVNSVELAVSKETTVGTFGDPVSLKSADEVASMGELLDQKDVGVCAFLMANDFSSQDFRSEVDVLIATCRAAEQIGAPAVRIDLIPHDKAMPEDEFVTRCAEAANHALAECSQVELAIENHGGTSNRPEFMDKVLDAAGEDRLAGGVRRYRAGGWRNDVRPGR